jgi:hypothetical protein
VFVSNVLQGSNPVQAVGTITRIDLTLTGDHVHVDGMTQIASGYTDRTDPAAIILGPTGLAYDAARDVLYVASTADNEIFAVAHAGTTKMDNGTGQVVYKDDAHLRGPLGLVLAPNGDLIAANGDAINTDTTNNPRQNSELVEFIPGDRAVGHPLGQFVGQFQLDPNPDGPFGIALLDAGGLLKLAAVNDNTNKLETFTFRERDTVHPIGDQHDNGGQGDQGASLAQFEAQFIDNFLRAMALAKKQARHHHHHHTHMMM